MQDSKGREASTQGSKSKEPLDERLSEATNDETLKEIEEKQEIGDSKKTSERDVPAPDAQPAESPKKRDDAGPI